ncbi:Gfo/Idh/MocA family protein [Armatimonas sp.]|uniref:Gfo/Idh/MocA family protein n=1 Tax=Armatimonas sp. TaxID=1872638 RepID=UPI003753950C
MSNRYTPLRWGILGAGSIANRFTESIALLSDQNVVAVGSRDAEKAAAFGSKHSITNRHGSYEALCSDPDVDAIYVATPHTFHKEHSILALKSGKHVLCEKPFTINRAEAEAVVTVAQETGLFLMEGMWSRFFPVWDKVRALIAEGAIGKPRMLYADFGFRCGPSPSNVGDDGKIIGLNPQARLFNPELGGGAIMDVGIYPVSLAQMLLGDPDQVACLGTIGHTGVDENAGMLLHFPSGAVAVMSTSFQVSTPQSATLIGESGKLEVAAPWWTPRKLTLTRGSESEVFELPFDGPGFQFEAMHFAERLRTGHTQSDILSHSDSLAVMGALDNLRSQIGLKYPME